MPNRAALTRPLFGITTMAERPDKQRRKEILKRIREEQRAKARAALPLSEDQLRALFDTLDRELRIEGCDRTLRLTRRFLEQQGLRGYPESLG